MKYIDMNNWPRREHFAFFYRMDYPQFNICMNLDITNFLNYTRTIGLQFYFGMIHSVTQVVNMNDDLKYRIREGKVLLHEKVHPSFTYLDNQSENEFFKIITVDMQEDIREFVKTTKATCLEQKDYFGVDKIAGRDDLVYLTCVPWISFTHISHTISLNRDDSVPRISWGKYFKEGNKIKLPFSVQVHHAVADGYQVGKYVEKLQEYLDEIG